MTKLLFFGFKEASQTTNGNNLCLSIHNFVNVGTGQMKIKAGRPTD